MAGKIKPMSQIKQLSTVMAVFQQTLNKKGCPFETASFLVQISLH